MVKWYNVQDKLPSYVGLVWVRRKTNQVDLAYHTGENYKNRDFRLATSVGDREGLSVEYYEYVTHWAELEEPKFTE